MINKLTKPRGPRPRGADPRGQVPRMLSLGVPSPCRLPAGLCAGRPAS